MSTNDKMVPVLTELSGTECEIPFYFKGKMAIPGEEHYGEVMAMRAKIHDAIKKDISYISGEEKE